MAPDKLYDLRSYLDLLKREDQLLVVTEEVDPCLEIAEIHRRVIARGGPALLFTKVKGSNFPVTTNLFGTGKDWNWPSAANRNNSSVMLFAWLNQLCLFPWPTCGKTKSSFSMVCGLG